VALAFPIAEYPLVENSLPPAPWPSADEMPTVAVLGSVLAVDWHDRVPWAPPALQLLGPAHLAIVAAAAFESARGARLSRR